MQDCDSAVKTFLKMEENIENNYLLLQEQFCFEIDQQNIDKYFIYEDSHDIYMGATDPMVLLNEISNDLDILCTTVEEIHDDFDNYDDKGEYLPAEHLTSLSLCILDTIEEPYTLKYPVSTSIADDNDTSFGGHTTEKPYRCKWCQKSFKQASVLYNHIQTHISSDENPTFPCDLCSKICKRKYDLALDKRKFHTALKPLACKICRKEFANLHTLKIHQQTHISKLHKCDQCPFAAKFKKELTKHKLKHTDKMAYSCTNCDKRFKTNQWLSRHQKKCDNLQYALSEGNIVYQCEICGNVYHHKSSLDIHTYMHDEILRKIKFEEKRAQRRKKMYFDIN